MLLVVGDDRSVVQWSILNVLRITHENIQTTNARLVLLRAGTVAQISLLNLLIRNLDRSWLRPTG